MNLNFKGYFVRLRLYYYQQEINNFLNSLPCQIKIVKKMGFYELQGKTLKNKGKKRPALDNLNGLENHKDRKIFLASNL